MRRASPIARLCGDSPTSASDLRDMARAARARGVLVFWQDDILSDIDRTYLVQVWERIYGRMNSRRQTP